MEILVAKKKDEKLKIKVVRQIKKGYAPARYLKILNYNDFNELALFFEDLDVLLNAPVEKAFDKYKRNKVQDFPFY